MNPKLFIIGSFGFGILGAAVGVAGYFDGSITYCQPSEQTCFMQSVPDWVQLNQGVTHVKHTPGMAGWKVLGALISCSGFATSMILARGLMTHEQQQYRLHLIENELTLRKAGLKAQAELEAFTQQALIESAEAVSATFEPYLPYLESEQPLIDGVDSLDPTHKIEPGQQSPPGESQPTNEPVRAVNTPQLMSKYGCELFDWNRFCTQPDEFPHIRIIGKTGKGKTMLADWLLDVLSGERFVITIKRQRKNWRGLKVYGLTRDYETCRHQLAWVLAEMDHRFNLIEKDIEPEMINFAVDEWRSISQNVKQLKDSQTGEVISPSAKEMMKEIITLARDAKLRMIALAQGKQVKTWGLEDESDLEECFTTIRLGHFAIEYAQSLRNACRKDSEEYQHWTAVLRELAAQGERCCMVEELPAVVPNLSNWRREGTELENWVERTKEMMEEYLNLEGMPPTSDNSDDKQDDSLALSDKAQKLLKYLRQRTQKTGQEWISVRNVQRGEPIKGANSKEIEALFQELAEADWGELNEKGDISLF